MNLKALALVGVFVYALGVLIITVAHDHRDRSGIVIGFFVAAIGSFVFTVSVLL